MQTQLQYLCLILPLSSIVMYTLSCSRLLQVFTSVQDAMGLVHMYPFLPDALEYLDCIAGLQSPTQTPEEPVTAADWEALLVYCAKVTAVDHFHYVPLLNRDHSSNSAATSAVNSAANSAVSPQQLSAAAANKTPSPPQRSVRFSPDHVSSQAMFPVSSSLTQSHSNSHSGEHVAPAYTQSPAQNQARSHQSHMLPALGQSQMAQDSSELARQVSRQGSNQIAFSTPPQQATSWPPQNEPPRHASLPLRQDQGSHRSSSYNQHEVAGQRTLHFPGQPSTFTGFSQALTHPTAASAAAMAPNPFFHSQLQPGQFLRNCHMFASQDPAQVVHQSSALHGFVSQGFIHQGHVIQNPAAEQLPAWLGQNLAYTHATPPQQSSPVSTLQQPGQMPAVYHASQGPNSKMVYPTAAMRSQQLSSAQNALTHSSNSVQAPLAPFLNEQLKRILAEGGPSGRRGF